MGKHKLLLLTIGVSLLVTGGVSAMAFQSYNPVRFSETDGYDPEFLKDPEVQKTAIDAHNDLKRVGLDDLGYYKQMVKIGLLKP